MTHLVPVLLGARSYNIYIGSGLLASAADIIAADAPASSLCIVTHPLLRPLYTDPLAGALAAQGARVRVVEIPAGERAKSLRNVERLYDAFLDAGLDRSGLVVVVGGGVLGDLAGFAAATYLRGIRFVQVPTTLLAQVDASVGGKTGIDLAKGKNLVGAFHQPAAVLIDTDTLTTLPRRELRAGLAEVVKYGIIYDEGFWNEVTARLPAILRLQPADVERAILRSCEIKAEVVAADETEQGLRAILNFGHTIGHAIETATSYRRYKHGEAVAIGMVSAALIGEELGETPPFVLKSILHTLSLAGLPYALPADVDDEAILKATYRDKKTLDGRLRFVLARRVGEVVTAPNVPESSVRAALIRQRAGAW